MKTKKKIHTSLTDQRPIAFKNWSKTKDPYTREIFRCNDAMQKQQVTIYPSLKNLFNSVALLLFLTSNQGTLTANFQ